MRVSRSSDSERPAGFLIRSAAAAIDAAAGVVLALLLSSTLGRFFARRAVLTLHIGDPHTLWKGALPFMLGAVGEFVYLLPFALLIVWILDPLTGATAGKRLLRLRVRRAGDDVSPLRFWCRSAIETIGLWGWTLALIAGQWQVGVVASAASLAVLAGAFTAAGPRSFALHDRLSGTMVCRLL